MLETPLYGRFQGENRRLIFSVPLIYLFLIRACIIGGGVGALAGFFRFDMPIMSGVYDWWLIFGSMVSGAGVLAAFSLHSITFDLKESFYRRRQGPGLIPRTTTGSTRDLDALVLIAEPNSRMLAGGVTYHLVLHWKNQREPSMVVQQDTRILVPGQPLNIAAQQLLARGMNYARALGIPFYDNSHFASPNPVRMLP